MLDLDTNKSYGVTSAILAWLVFFSFMATLLFSVVFFFSHTNSSNYEYFRGVHMSLGCLLIIVVGLRLAWWLKNPRIKAPKRMTENAYGWSRLSLLALYVSIFGVASTGVIHGGGMQLQVSLFGLFELPLYEIAAVDLTQYLHRLLLILNAAALLMYAVINLYYGKRYQLGYRRMLPGLHA
jgi:cytochrome b561